MKTVCVLNALGKHSQEASLGSRGKSKAQIRNFMISKREVWTYYVLLFWKAPSALVLYNCKHNAVVYNRFYALITVIRFVESE